MLKLLGLLGVLSAALAIADVIHGQNNGDIHRTYIHVPEFIVFLGFLCILEFLSFRFARNKFNLNPWLVLIAFVIVSIVINFALFVISGGGFHGDGGPISTGFLAMSAAAETCVPVAVIGFVVSAVSRKNAGFPVLRR